MAQLAVTIDMPEQGSSASVRHHQFVDTTNGTQLAITIVSVNGASVGKTNSYTLSTGGSSLVTCTNASPPVCTLSASIPAGLDVLEFTEEDTNNRPLAQNIATVNVVAGTNSISITLNGLVASLATPVCGTPVFENDGQHVALTIAAKDLDGATINAPGVYGAVASSSSAVLNPLAISSSNANVTFSVSGAAASNPATIKSPADTVTMIYNGPAPSGTTVPVSLAATVTNSVPGVTPVSAVTANCSVSSNSSYSADPVTTFSNVAASAIWGSPSTSNAFSAGCSSSTETLCYYPISGGSFGPITTTSAGSFSFTYSGYALLNYSSTAYSSFTIQSIVLTFTDTANSANSFVASFGPSTIAWLNGASTTPTSISTFLAAPSAPTFGKVSNGTGTTTNDYVVLTYVNARGETTQSPNSSQTLLTGQSVIVNSPAAEGNATGYNVYAAQSTATSYTGPYYLQNTTGPIAIGTTYTLGPTVAASGTQPPSSNTTAGASVSNTYTISGGSGVFAGVTGSLTAPFLLSSSGGTQSMFSSTTDSGTIYGI
jgi:hypothetical protein